MEFLKMCCWRRVQAISWTDLMRNGSLKGVEEERNILHTRKTNWIGHKLALELPSKTRY